MADSSTGVIDGSRRAYIGFRNARIDAGEVDSTGTSRIDIQTSIDTVLYAMGRVVTAGHIATAPAGRANGIVTFTFPTAESADTFQYEIIGY